MWRHAKYQDSFFEGQYSTAKNNAGDEFRIFILVPVNNKKIKTLKFSSWQSAKKAGWKKNQVTEKY